MKFYHRSFIHLYILITSFASFVSCTLNIFAPLLSRKLLRAVVPFKAVFALVFVANCTIDFLEIPTKIGRLKHFRQSKFLAISKFCSIVLLKPNPGSKITSATPNEYNFSSFLEKELEKKKEKPSKKQEKLRLMGGLNQYDRHAREFCFFLSNETDYKA